LIFVTVGTQFSFDRLIMAVDAWAERNRSENVVGQIGHGRYKPSYIDAYPFIVPAEFQRYQNEARLLISHAGMGAILNALEGAKPLIVMPRKVDLGEHRNDHQLATARRFQGTPGIHVANDVDELNELLERSSELSACSGVASHASSELIDALRRFLSGDELRAPGETT
jgi:UDP-N-acetylglucosamine transferase subunit ALG13